MKNITKIVTFYIIPLLIVLVLVYDFIAIKYGGTEASISSLIISFSYKMPMFTFLVGFGGGFLCGHLFWRLRSNEDTVLIDKVKSND